MKIFISPSIVSVPPAWLGAMNAPGHLRQAWVVVVAESKNDATALLAGVGASPHLAPVLSQTKGLISTPLMELLGAQVITVDQPGVYAWLARANNEPVVRVTAVSVTVAAHWRRVPARSDGRLLLVPAAVEAGR